jgi:nucleoside-diphosphate-sugar epimerase
VPNARSGRRALVTGATGFIGRHLVSRLVEEGWEVHAIVRPASATHVLPAPVHTHIDDGSEEAMDRVVAASSPHVCFHLASQVVGQHASSDVDRLVTNNVAFGARVAEALAHQGPVLMVNAGTAWQHVGGQSYSPASLYAATKQAFQDVLQYYAEVHQLRVVNLKLYGTYGSTNPRHRLLSLLMEAARTSEVFAATPGEQLIDLVHVDDVVRALMVAADRYAAAEPPLFESFAVSSGAPITVRQLAARIEAVIGSPVPVQWGARPYRPREMLTHWHAGDPLPGWTPRVSLNDGLREIWMASGGVHEEGTKRSADVVREGRTA